MYTNHSASDLQMARYGTNEDLGGLFKSIGKVFKGAAKVVGKVAAPVLGAALSIPVLQAAQVAAAAQSPNQPYTGGVGVAVSGADQVNARLANIEASQFALASQPRQAGITSGLPSWAVPVGLAAVAGIALILVLRK